MLWGKQVQIRPIDWLWEPWLAQGVVAVIDGDPGVGKSSLTMDLVARITTGQPFPSSISDPSKRSWPTRSRSGSWGWRLASFGSPRVDILRHGNATRQEVTHEASPKLPEVVDYRASSPRRHRACYTPRGQD